MKYQIWSMIKIYREMFYLSYSGLLLLELTELQYFCSTLIVELLLEGMEKLDSLSKATASEIKMNNE